MAAALRLPGGELAVVAATAGDRSDEAIHAMGVIVGNGADRVAVADQHQYLRGRAAGEMAGIWAGGAAEAGMLDVDRFDDEVTALGALLGSGLPPGSVIAVCCLEQREEAQQQILAGGGHPLDPAETAARVEAAR